MFFREFVKNNKEDDIQNDSYTRYLVMYNYKLHMPILIEIKSNNNDLSISIYDTDLPIAVDEQLVDGSYKSLLKTEYFSDDGLDFSVHDQPISSLTSSVFAGKPVIQIVQTKDEFARKGLGSLLLQLAQNYYDKCGIFDYEKEKRIYACKNNYPDNLVYANKIERRLGVFGDVISHTKAKVLGPQQDKAYSKFLEKNNFNCETSPYQMPNKLILRKRNLISSELFDEQNKPDIVQCLGDLIDISSIHDHDVLERE